MNPYALSGLASFWELVREIPPWRFLPLQWDMDLLEYPSKLFLSVRVGLTPPWTTRVRGLQGGPYGASLISNDSLAYIAALYPLRRNIRRLYTARRFEEREQAG